MTEIDMDDRMRLTDYRGYEKTDRVIGWFLECLGSCFDRLDLSLYEDYESLEQKLCLALRCVFLLNFLLGYTSSQRVAGRRKALGKSNE